MAHIKICKLQGLDYKSLLDLIGGSNILLDYTHYIMENYGNSGHVFLYPNTELQKTNINEESQMKIMSHHLLKLHALGMRKSVSVH